MGPSIKMTTLHHYNCPITKRLLQDLDVDFVNVIEQLGIRDIPTVGLSYIGQQGRLVCSNPYVSTIVDLNKTESGYESCIVGQNNVTDLDAYKAIELLKAKLRKKEKKDFVKTQKTDSDCL